MKLLHLRYTLYALFIMFFVSIIPASAQDETPVNLTLDGDNVTIKHEVETTAEVELTVGDQLYVLNVPVKIQIDETLLLKEALLSVPANWMVGIFAIEPIALEVIEGEYEKQFRTVIPGTDETVVVYRANVTNLHSETIQMGFTSNLEVVAVDAVGNTYDEEARLCDDLNPGATIECEFIFKAPATADLVDLNVKAADFEQFAFPAVEAE